MLLGIGQISDYKPSHTGECFDSPGDIFAGRSIEIEQYRREISATEFLA
jgi:hypothetical protein